MKIKAIIVDDEEMSQLNLCLMLEETCRNVEVCGYAPSVESALTLINDADPDLVFLDIQLSGYSGFDLLDACRSRGFEVIFVTAYNEYALKALKQQAIDYILKPIDTTELITAVEKVLVKKRTTDTAAMLEEFGKKNRKKDFLADKLQIPFEAGIQFIEIDKIIRCRADDCYSEVYLDGGKKIICTLILAELENRLETSSFVRVHKSHLVNMNYIVKYHRTDGGFIELSDGSQIPVSRRKKDEVVKIFKSDGSHDSSL